MPEDVAPDESPDTPDAPEASGPPEGTPAAEPAEGSAPADDGWKDRYDHLQPEFTRATQKLTQYEQFIEAAMSGDPQVLAQLGIELQDDGDDDNTDPEDLFTQRFDKIESYLQERADAEAEAEVLALEDAFLTQELTALQGNESVEFSAEERQALLGLADRLRDDDGIPDVKGAYDLLSKASESRQQRYLKSKKADRVEVGTAATEKVNLADDDSRVNLLADMMAAGSDD